MVIDMHTHLFGRQYEEQKAKLRKAMDLYDISKIYVSAINGIPNPSEDMIAEANNEVYKFVREEPERVGGYVYISPDHKNAADALKHGIEDLGLEGVKLWMSTFCDAPCVNPIIEKSIDYGIPILIHSFQKAVGQLPRETLGGNVAVLARRYPEAKLIMAHLGGNCYHGIPAIRDLPNVCVDLSCSIFRGDDLQYTVNLLGAERVLFGSDMPGSYLVNYGQVLEINVSDEERDLILYKNAIRLFDRNFRWKEEYTAI